MAENEDVIYFKSKAYEIIKNMIINGVLPPGSPISEKRLIEEIGSSRTPIRDALSKLEKENFVRIYPKRGVFVTDVSVNDAIDIYTIREALEPLAARLATVRIDLEALKPYIELYSKKNYDITLEEHIRIDKEFHSLIANNTGIVYLSQILEGIYDQNNRIRMMSMVKVKDRQDGARKEHLDIINCILKRDSVAAETAMRMHISRAKEIAMTVR